MRFRGLGNIEFKRDPRDGELKVIESNVRFTQAHELLVRAGMDSAMIIYNHVTGLPQPDVSSYAQNVKLLFIRDDIHAFRQLHARGELGWFQWLRSLAHRQTFPYFSLSDPWPAVRNFLSRVERKRKGYGRESSAARRTCHCTRVTATLYARDCARLRSGQICRQTAWPMCSSGATRWGGARKASGGYRSWPEGSH